MVLIDKKRLKYINKFDSTNDMCLDLLIEYDKIYQKWILEGNQPLTTSNINRLQKIENKRQKDKSKRINISTVLYFAWHDYWIKELYKDY